MGKANELVDDLIERPLSPKEIQERQEAKKPHGKLVATLDGQLVEPALIERPTVVRSAPQQVWD